MCSQTLAKPFLYKHLFILFGHFHASLLIFAGVDPVSVSADLGHTAVSTTTSLYCHMFREAQARNCDVIAKALNFDDDSPEDAASDMKLSEKAQERPAV